MKLRGDAPLRGVLLERKVRTNKNQDLFPFVVFVEGLDFVDFPTNRCSKDISNNVHVWKEEIFFYQAYTLHSNECL